jgi:hypothetical protein
MGLFDWFKGDAPVVEYQEESLEVFDSKGFRKGTWVMTPDGVGVVTANGVELAKEDGTRKMVVGEGDKAVADVTYEVLRKATVDEIPVSRRG